MKYDNVTVRINLGGKAGLEVEKTFPSWEVHLLNEIHGEDNVIEQSRATAEVEFNAKEVWESLLRKYGTATDKKGEQIVRIVFPNPAVLERFVDRTAPTQARAKVAA